jgi:transcriptional regulator with XRE-family HTH domain
LARTVAGNPPKNFQKSFKSLKRVGWQASLKEFAMSVAVSYARRSLEPYCIGMKLRALRTYKRLTLARLAVETGLSTALLSKLETDRMIPTLPTLATICRVYGVGLSYFFSEPERHSLSLTRKAHLQSSGRGSDPVKRIPLHAVSENSRLVAEIVELSPGGASFAPGMSRQANIVAYVLEGYLQMDAGGVQDLLEAGDCAYIDSQMTLAWSAAGKHRCRVLVVTPAATVAE